MKSIIALSVLFVAQTAAKIGFGPCPLPSFMDYSAYSRSYVATAVYNHKIMWGDANVNDLLGLAKTFV